MSVSRANAAPGLPGLATFPAADRKSDATRDARSLTDRAAVSQPSCFMRYCAVAAGQRLARRYAVPIDWQAWDDFHAFSVQEFRTFWDLFLGWSGILHDGTAEPVCDG